jgi:hypothetical protein
LLTIPVRETFVDIVGKVEMMIANGENWTWCAN